MGRAIGAVVAAFALWGAVWLGAGAGIGGAFPDAVQPGQPVTSTVVLLAYIAASVVISVLSGYVCAALKGAAPTRSVWALALILLAVGFAVEVAGWALTPAWYHLVFLALLVPATVWGGALRGKAAA
jgi:hypothetical protein